MNEPRADRFCRERYRFGALRLHRIEALAAAFKQNADEVDDNVGAAHRRRHRMRIAEVGLHRVNLADPAHGPQMAGKLGPAHRDADPTSFLRQRAHHMAAEKPRTAEYGDQRLKFCFCGHRRPAYRIVRALYRGAAESYAALGSTTSAIDRSAIRARSFRKNAANNPAAAPNIT